MNCSCLFHRPLPRKATSSSFSLLRKTSCSRFVILRLNFVSTSHCRKCPACLTILFLSSHLCGRCQQPSLWSLGVRFLSVFPGVNSCLIFWLLSFLCVVCTAALARRSMSWGETPGSPSSVSIRPSGPHSPAPLAPFLSSWAGLSPPLLVCLLVWVEQILYLLAEKGAREIEFFLFFFKLWLR